jgi:hypothetical protein
MCMNEDEIEEIFIKYFETLSVEAQKDILERLKQIYDKESEYYG